MIRLDDQVAVVTGAGRGIGRAHALLLAERGAAVIINDVAIEPDGRPRAQLVVDEIEARGGTAVASSHDASSQEQAAALIGIAEERFDRLDILVHNAGLTHRTLQEQSLAIPAGFSDADLTSVRAQIELQLLGSYYLGQPAWRLMEARGYGRIVLTASSAIFGYAGDGAYGAAKNGLVTLARTMHVEATSKDLNIRANALSPSAATAAGHAAHAEAFRGRNTPEMVAGALVYLASPECEIGGECFRVGGSYAGLNFIGLTQGWIHTGDEPFTPEQFRDRLPEVMSREGYVVPENVPAAMSFMAERVQGELDSRA